MEVNSEASKNGCDAKSDVIAFPLKYMGTLGHNFQGKTFRVMEHASGGPKPTNCPLVRETAMANAEGLRDYCALAFWRGCSAEAMAVARCYYDLIYEEQYEVRFTTAVQVSQGPLEIRIGTATSP